MELRTATAADFEEVFGLPAPHTFHAVVAVDEGTVAGIGGIMFADTSIAFMHVCDGVDLRKHKRMLVRALRLFKKMLRNHHQVLAAPADEVTAPGFLQHVGFERVEEGVYLWRR